MSHTEPEGSHPQPYPSRDSCTTPGHIPEVTELKSSGELGKLAAPAFVAQQSANSDTSWSARWRVFSETRFGFRITTLVLPESLVTHELTLARSLLFSDHCRRKNFLAAIRFQFPGRVSLPILVDDCLSALSSGRSPPCGADPAFFQSGVFRSAGSAPLSFHLNSH